MGNEDVVVIVIVPKHEALVDQLLPQSEGRQWGTAHRGQLASPVMKIAPVQDMAMVVMPRPEARRHPSLVTKGDAIAGIAAALFVLLELALL
ncbi:hypothetical protein PG996_001846 [Apiospora saccharicola]|uniref:Uncharacterized protein n=1 Tax=Apiospora saccharicola TaxID=335842 RepID=A0ABR1WHS4_9PEZI